MKSLRLLSFEQLQPRYALTAGLCNLFNALDVNDDGFVAALDALLVINRLNGTRPPGSKDLPDVNDDGLIAPLDAILVINHINRSGDARPPLVISLAPDDDLDGNRVVLRSHVTLEGQSTAGVRLRLRTGSGKPLFATADAGGRFQFVLDLPPGLTNLQVDAVDSLRRGVRLGGDVRVGDVILDWNATMLNVVRDWTTLSNDPYPNRVVTSPPPLVARNLAMVHAAMFDAMNSIHRQYESYRVDIVAPAGASPVAAAAAAAHRVASNLYREPDELAVFDAALTEALNTVPDGQGKSDGVTLGEQVGDAILAWRSHDGATATVVDTPGNQPGDWNRTFPDYYPPLLPQWPNVATFSIDSASQFLPGPPPAIESAEYAAAVDQVMGLGGFNSQTRTTEQTEIALFWSDGGGTYTPPGHWNQIASDVSLEKGQSPVENARLFALLNAVLADAAIVCWDAKYSYDLWRPIDAIRKADTDGNDLTTGDSSWTPLLRTPPFPSYTSGHSTFSGAADAVLTAIFGSDVQFTSQADGHNGFTQRPLGASQLITRSFISFSAAAEEAGMSRIYGGIHYAFDNTAGLVSGRAIGSQAVVSWMRPVTDFPGE